MGKWAQTMSNKCQKNVIFFILEPLECYIFIGETINNVTFLTQMLQKCAKNVQFFEEIRGIP